MRTARFIAMLVGLAACERTSASVDPDPVVDAPAEQRAKSTTSLQRFDSAKELAEFIQRRTSAHAHGVGGLGLVGTGMGGGGTGEGTVGLGNVGLIGKGGGGGSVTNTQEADVAEGGIVAVHGDHVVVLRRGRLFTVKVGGDALEPVDGLDVGSKRDHDAWYDEMLIHDDEVIVIGYSYAFGATEIARFSISSAGKLQHTVTDYLRSNDYYSSRNYTSRLIGDTLVFYLPHQLRGGWPTDEKNSGDVPSMCTPARGQCSTWTSIIEATEVYALDDGPADVLHTVVTCDLSRSAAGMKCKGTGILGPYSRNFYVSADAVYVWINDPSWTPPPPWAPAGAPSGAVVYRLGLADRTVSAVRSHGAPTDQFSFAESEGHLDVLVRAQGAGDGMWGAEANASLDVALFRVPLSAFAPGKCAAIDPATYVDLPDPEGSGDAFHNRFVGDAVLYGMGAGWDRPADGEPALHVHRIGKGETTTLRLSQPVDRIEPLGKHAIVVGAAKDDLAFEAIELGAKPKTAGKFRHEDANQGETRSHGFFYAATSDAEGTLGLPIRRGGEPTSGQLFQNSAAVLYLTVDQLEFERLGALEADPTVARDDKCRVSCVDWYGNARPLFLGDRVLALLGYELVEGKRRGAKLRERRRVNMLPALRGR